MKCFWLNEFGEALLGLCFCSLILAQFANLLQLIRKSCLNNGGKQKTTCSSRCIQEKRAVSCLLPLLIPQLISVKLKSSQHLYFGCFICARYGFTDKDFGNDAQEPEPEDDHRPPEEIIDHFLDTTVDKIEAEEEMQDALEYVLDALLDLVVEKGEIKVCTALAYKQNGPYAYIRHRAVGLQTCRQ